LPRTAPRAQAPTRGADRVDDTAGHPQQLDADRRAVTASPAPGAPQAPTAFGDAIDAHPTSTRQAFDSIGATRHRGVGGQAIDPG